MRKTLSLSILMFLLSSASAVAAQPQPSPVTIKAAIKVSKGKGTKSAPVPVSVSYTLDIGTTDGSRPESVKVLTLAWEGVRSYGKYFPTCSAEKIAAAQSDKGCPKGSLIGTGTIHSLVAPDNDFSSMGAVCDRTTHTYNAGPGKNTVIFVGPASKCLGTAYTAPFTGTWGNTGGLGGGQATTNAPPVDQSRPVPGLLVSTTHLTFTFPKRVITVKGKKVSYLMSVGCKGTRAARVTYLGQPSGRKVVVNKSAGSC